MVSSLAAQLAQNASLNSALISNKSRRKPTESYLFTGREADKHDLESIHALGSNGFLQLASLNPDLRKFDGALFSDAAKGLDKTLQPAEINEELDRNIGTFLRLLGPYLMEGPTGKVLEWLVRRFRINEFNVEDVLALFMPYHESPHFAKMLTILHIKEQSVWSFLLAFKSAAQKLPRISLVTEMLKNTDVARFVTALLPNSIEDGHCHRTLVAFNAACLHDFMVRSKSLDEGTVAFLLPALLEPLQKHREAAVPSAKDAILGSYILLSTLSQKCHIASKALEMIVGAMAGCANLVATKQFVNAVVSVCDPQDILDKFLDATNKAVLRLPNVNGEIQSALVWVGVEHFLCPLLSGLCRRIHKQAASSLLETVISSTNAPTAVIRRVTVTLIMQVTSAQNPVADVPEARRLLCNIQQRHPALLHKAAEELISQEDGLKEAVEQLIISLSIDYPKNNAVDESGVRKIIDMIVASTSADTKVRVIAVNALVNVLVTTSNLEASELEAIHSALLARVQDTSTQVLEALYDNVAIVLPILSKEPQSCIDHVSRVLSASESKPSRALLRVHLTFFASHFCCEANNACLADVFHRLFFPFLLFSKSRQHSADATWEIIAKSDEESGIAKYELLGGCVDAWSWENGKDGIDNVGKMAGINLAVASKIAENIMVSDNYRTHLDTLLVNLREDNPHSRALGYLVTRALLGRLSGEHQIDAADQVLQVMGIEQLTGMESSLHGVDNFQNIISDTNLARNAVLKPSSRNTLNWLQTSIVALLPTIPPPMGLVLDWLIDVPTSSANGKGRLYVGLMRKLYKLANSASVPNLSTNLLQALFVNIKDDALAFLAGVWINSPMEIKDDQFRLVSLRHATAFLEAHRCMQDFVDFQTMLPSLIVVLQTLDVQEREAASKCMATLLSLTEKRFSTVYAFDTIYGESSVKLQYLDRSDYRKYLGALAEHRDHLAADPNYIRVFHQQHLGRDKSDKKKEAEYKQRVLCYLLSHVNAIRLPSAQLALLKTLEDVSGHVKAQMLLPVIEDLVKDLPSRTAFVDRLGPCLEEFSTLVVSSFDASFASDLNEKNGPSWPIFMLSLRHYFQPGSLSSPRESLTRALEHGLFASLSSDRKVEICQCLLEIGSQTTDMYLSCKLLLSNILQEDVSLMVRLLTCLQPPTNEGNPRASKRAKITEIPEDTLPSLSLLAEVLGTKSLPGSRDLITRLLETLGKVTQSASPTQTDLSYIQQHLMSAVESAADKKIDASTNAMRLDVLVELIRVVNNPQAFHQALMLMANLARIAPYAVLHQVMPVFTFMGSNVFHRDDSYSFKVVQKTVDSIVPIMVSSLKYAHSEPFDLYVGSKDFLRIFTDAANHIPRHRRTNFFAHLVDVLGPDDFLAPVLMLLIEKSANRVVRQTTDEIQASLALPISILQHHSIPVQMFALEELLRESRRLVARVLDPEDLQPTFLDTSCDEHALPSSAVLKRRSQALITFIGYGLKATPAGQVGNMNDLISLLIDLATMKHGTSSERNVDDIFKAARSSMNRAVGIMSARDFIHAILSMMESKEHRVQAGALDLLDKRLIGVTDKIRHEATPTVVKIIRSIQRLLTLHPDDPLAESAFRALRTISLTTCPGEESSLTAVVPLVISGVRNRTMALPAIEALPSLTCKLGPRIIPYLREIVAECVAVLHENLKEPSPIVDGTLKVIHSLLSSIPTFWGTGELSHLIKLYVDQCAVAASPHAGMTSLAKAISKQVPMKAVLPVMCEMWPPLYQSGNLDRFAGYFQLLKRSLRSCPGPVVLEHLRPLFKVFLDAFDVTKISSSKSDEAEAQAISAFLELVVKLNETAFRPLFRRLYDWAFANETDAACRTRRIIAFCHVYISLLDFFKGLMCPYMSFVLSPFVEILKTFASSSADDQTTWSCVVQTLAKSFAYDEGAFWRDDKLRQIAPVLVEQVAVSTRLGIPDGRTALPDCLGAMADCVDDDALLKTINLNLLMHTRSEDTRLCLFALACSEALWRTHGGKLLGFVPETTTFITECAEHENDSVVKASRKLKDAVESIAGNIDGL